MDALMDEPHRTSPTAGVFSLPITLDQSAQPMFPHRGVRQFGYPIINSLVCYLRRIFDIAFLPGVD